MKVLVGRKKLGKGMREQQRADRQALKSRLEVEFGLTDHPKRDSVFEMAWERGHAWGVEEVTTEYSYLVRLVKMSELNRRTFLRRLGLGVASLPMVLLGAPSFKPENALARSKGAPHRFVAVFETPHGAWKRTVSRRELSVGEPIYFFNIETYRKVGKEWQLIQVDEYVA